MGLNNLVEGCPLFYDLYDEEIEKILKSCVVVTFEKGSSVITQGEDGKEIYIVLRGAVEITRRPSKRSKTEISLGTLKRGELFGEMVLINKNKRTASVTAIQESDLLVINYDSVFELYTKNTKIFALLLLNMARLLTNRLDSTGSLIEKISKK